MLNKSCFTAIGSHVDQKGGNHHPAKKKLSVFANAFRACNVKQTFAFFRRQTPKGLGFTVQQINLFIINI
jgi:hypothetical protein